MTAEQALNALGERVASLRAMSRKAAYQRRDEGDEDGYTRRLCQCGAYTDVLAEIAELRKKL